MSYGSFRRKLSLPAEFSPCWVYMNTSQTCERESVAKERLQSLLNEFDVARITGLSVASVRRWRLLRQGPKYLKIGAAVRYEPKDISAWLASRSAGASHAPDAPT